MTASRELAEKRGLSKRAIKDIDALHFALNAMKLCWYEHKLDCQYETKDDKLVEKFRKDMRKAVRRIEYQLQDLWGFPRDKKLHTWVHTFEGLLEEKKS